MFWQYALTKLQEIGTNPQYINHIFWYLGHLKEFPISDRSRVHAWLQDVALNNWQILGMHYSVMNKVAGLYVKMIV
jgi:hypothetical protein